MAGPSQAETTADRVPLPTKLFFGFGSVAEGTKNTAFNVFLLFYYNQVLGLPGTLSGAAIFIALCFDAITDPLVGSFSDSFHSRWGRRHPFMYVSALPMAIFFYLLFDPPAGLGETGLFLWLTGFAIGVRISMTFYMIPSSSMIPEVTDHYDERTSLVSFRFLFGWMGGLGISVLAYQVFFAPSEVFETGQLDPSRYPGFGLFCAIAIAVSILTSTRGTQSLIPRLMNAPPSAPFTLGRVIGEVREVISNRSYRTLILAALFGAVALGFSDVVGLYVNTYFWEFTTDEITLLLIPLIVATWIAFALVRPVSERFDKKSTALGLSMFAVALGPLPIFLRLLGWMPANGEPLLLYLIMGHALLVVTAFISIMMLIVSMIADTVDQNELVTGKRQEGLFTSAIAFTTKATSGIGGFVAGIALDWIQFPQQAEVGSIPPEKIFALGLAVGPGMLIFYVLTLVFLSRYRITREEHREILAELGRRKAAVETAA